jgi:hypothetical protein
MVYIDELLAVAKRIFWFGTPEKALAFPRRFLTYAMMYASDEDNESLRSTSATLISQRYWMTLHLGFSRGARGPNGMNATPAYAFHRFRSGGFEA